MSYLDEIKEKVVEGKLEVLESYKQFMDEIVVPDFVRQTGTNCAIVSRETIIEEGINVDNFISWLKKEGFTVVAPQSDGLISISYYD